MSPGPATLLIAATSAAFGWRRALPLVVGLLGSMVVIMVLVGGMGSLFGPAFGAAAYLLFEEWVPDLMEQVVTGSGENWHFIFGPLLVILVLFAKQGLWGLIPGNRSKDD